MKKILAALIALFPFWGFSAENQPDARPAGASAPGSRPVPVRIRQIGQKPAAEADKAVVTLTVEYNWGDGTGYQLLLDADATAFGTLFPSDANVGYWNESGGIADSVYAGFEYKIPADASGDLDAGRFVLAGESVSVAIDPGTYDFVVPCMMPFYYCVAFSSYGQNRGDDFAFEAGMEYVFHPSVGIPFTSHNSFISSISIYHQLFVSGYGELFQRAPYPVILIHASASAFVMMIFPSISVNRTDELHDSKFSFSIT